ncbi:HlyD family secretion protein [Noviherbaspirillum sp. Root189]|uniref:HlyD family secretion protein n=1 Tax=Noviherbaspirillum sp. Root189 TaxID=1736487 RepID=UPI00070E3AE4|nr:HlyD family secretion protein [Noviherbaspirillum sp. Root189]KRB89954.1 hemolysin secretion protein D [Noviherbaspirillum sp. Root189]
MSNLTEPSREASASENTNPPVPTDSHDESPSAVAPPPPKKIKPKPLTVVLMAGLALVGIALILWAWHLGPFNTPVVTTDNAYVRGPITVLAPQVSGYIDKVLVKDFDHVKAGQPLVHIDNRIYAEKVAQAKAQRDNAVAQLANAEQTQAQNLASLGASRANLAAVEAEVARAKAELARVEELAAKGSVSLNERDKVRTNARLAAANVQKAKADIKIAEERVKATKVSRAGLDAQVKMAEAQRALAEIDLANTVIRAPRDGQVSEASVRQGQYVAAGSQLLFLVPDAMWVVANFKETQTYGMGVGQRASFTVDALDGASLTGRVEEIAPATGSEFSVLRPDNASGNFTKVVQRLPVRIAIDPDQPLAQRLRPGMSVIARVDTAGGQERAR